MMTLIAAVLLMFLITAQLALIAASVANMAQGQRTPRALRVRLYWAAGCLIVCEQPIHSVWILGPLFLLIATGVLGAAIYATYQKGPRKPTWLGGAV